MKNESILEKLELLNALSEVVGSVETSIEYWDRQRDEWQSDLDEIVNEIRSDNPSITEDELQDRWDYQFKMSNLSTAIYRKKGFETILKALEKLI